MIYEAELTRADWRALKLGWLLAFSLDGPMLVFDEADSDAAQRLERHMDEYAAAIWNARRSMARKLAGAGEEYARAVAKLKKIHGLRCDLAIGYSFPDVRAMPECLPVLFVFPDRASLFGGAW